MTVRPFLLNILNVKLFRCALNNTVIAQSVYT